MYVFVVDVVAKSTMTMSIFSIISKLLTDFFYRFHDCLFSAELNSVGCSFVRRFCLVLPSSALCTFLLFCRCGKIDIRTKDDVDFFRFCKFSNPIIIDYDLHCFRQDKIRLVAAFNDVSKRKYHRPQVRFRCHWKLSMVTSIFFQFLKTSNLFCWFRVILCLAASMVAAANNVTKWKYHHPLTAMYVQFFFFVGDFVCFWLTMSL
jgi:hypothetical protein